MATNDEIARAAIKADMQHRGYDYVADGEFCRSETFGPRTQIEDRYWVSASGTDVTVRIERDPAGYDFSSEEAALASSLQTSVFGFWPGAIDNAFRDWDRSVLPSEAPFGVIASLARSAAAEVSTGVSVDDGSSGYSPGNPRLSSDLGNLESRTKQLNGTYAATFSDNYVTPLPAVVERHCSLIRLLAAAAAAEQEIWRRVHADVADVRTSALAAMEASGPTDGGGDTDWRVILTVAGAVAAGVATVATAGTATALAAGLTGAASSAVGSLIASPSEEAVAYVGLGSNHPHGVLANLLLVLAGETGSLNATLTGQETRVRDSLSAVAGQVDGSDRAMFDLPEPEISTAPSGEVLDAAQVVTVDAESIARIVSLWIPSICGDLRAARRRVVGDNPDAWTRPAGIGLGTTGPMRAYVRLRDSVVRCLGTTAGELEDAGVALGDAARIIGMADADIRRRYERQARRIVELNVNHVA